MKSRYDTAIGAQQRRNRTNEQYGFDGVPGEESSRYSFSKKLSLVLKRMFKYPKIVNEATHYRFIMHSYHSLPFLRMVHQGKAFFYVTSLKAQVHS